MKLAQALEERSDLDKRLAQLKERCRRNARYTEGEEPQEDAPALLQEMRELLARRDVLVGTINLTNARTVIDGMTITELISLRDRLHREQQLLNEIADAAGGDRDSYYGGRRRSELPMKTDLRVREIRAEADRLAGEYRRVDSVIQQSNWDTELIG
jgi:hypothetical protein